MSGWRVACTGGERGLTKSGCIFDFDLLGWRLYAGLHSPVPVTEAPAPSAVLPIASYTCTLPDLFLSGRSFSQTGNRHIGALCANEQRLGALCTRMMQTLMCMAFFVRLRHMIGAMLGCRRSRQVVVVHTRDRHESVGNIVRFCCFTRRKPGGTKKFSSIASFVKGSPRSPRLGARPPWRSSTPWT